MFVCIAKNIQDPLCTLIAFGDLTKRMTDASDPNAAGKGGIAALHIADNAGKQGQGRFAEVILVQDCDDAVTNDFLQNGYVFAVACRLQLLRKRCALL